MQQSALLSGEVLPPYIAGVLMVMNVLVDLMQVLRYIAERMHLRHPNLVTVMGATAEPVTEDPLLVPALALAHLLLLSPNYCQALPCTSQLATAWAFRCNNLATALLWCFQKC